MGVFEAWKGVLFFMLFGASLLSSQVAHGARGRTLSSDGDEADSPRQAGDKEEAQISFAQECDHCLKVTFFDLGLGCSCIYHCCRSFHYAEKDVNKMPNACQNYYYDTPKWKECKDPCLYCSKSKYFGKADQDNCFRHCCAVAPSDAASMPVDLSYRFSASCAEWQNDLRSNAELDSS